MLSQMKKSLQYATLFMAIFVFTNSYAFMSGVSPEKDGGANLHILKGQIFKGPSNVEVNAGYGIIRNTTEEDIKLIRLTSPVFDEVQMHDMEYSSDGKAKMVQIKEPVIPAKSEMVLEHGGKHLMLINRRRALEVGEIIKIMAESKKEKRYMIELQVVDPRQKGSSGHHDHGGMHSH